MENDPPPLPFRGRMFRIIIPGNLAEQFARRRAARQPPSQVVATDNPWPLVVLCVLTPRFPFLGFVAYLLGAAFPVDSRVRTAGTWALILGIVFFIQRAVAYLWFGDEIE